MPARTNSDFFERAKVVKTKAIKPDKDQSNSAVNAVRERIYEADGVKRRTVEIPIEEIENYLENKQKADK